MDPFRRVAFSRVALLTAVLGPAASSGGVAGAQMRPVSPVNWHLVGGTRAYSAGIGIGLLTDQQASLAGTSGDLREYGNFRAGLRSGRIVLEVAGTLLRHFADRKVLREPLEGAGEMGGATRRDAGDVVASTTIRINGTGRAQAALRFGTRLPTPSDEAGLDRDRTDFFSTVAGRYRAGRVVLAAEGGLAILGTRIDGLDQLDVLVYSAGVDLAAGPVTVSGIVVGRDDMHSGVVRGNEDLSEVRLGLTAGDRTWVELKTVFGLSEYSPRNGLLLMVGLRR